MGSDRSPSSLLKELEDQEIKVTFNQDGTQISKDTDLFVYSEAIPEDAPERLRANELGIPQKNYFEALGELSDGYTVIAVCGSHGKSSTTAMAADVLIEAGLDPTVVVGTKAPALNGKNWRKGESNLFLVEACEYRGSFFNLKPKIILLTTVDWDHVDAYPTPELYRDAYITFLKKLSKEDGLVITHMQDKDCSTVVLESDRSYLDADSGEGMQKIAGMNVPGSHMEQNARLALQLALELDINKTDAISTLRNFKGTWRRMEEIGEWNGATVVDDYAHHPREIIATIAAMSAKYPKRRKVYIFQPHMNNRTKVFYKDFVNALKGFPVIITDVYEARKEEVSEVNLSENLAKDIDCPYASSFDEVEDFLRKKIEPNDVLVFMGAGDITNLARKLIKKS